MTLEAEGRGDPVLDLRCGIITLEAGQDGSLRLQEGPAPGCRTYIDLIP